MGLKRLGTYNWHHIFTQYIHIEAHGNKKIN